MLHLTLTTLEATERLGGLLADSMCAAACRVLLMHGDLGSGKTTLTRALVARLPGGATAEVSSPSFTLCNHYPTRPPVVHCDLYRGGGVPDDAPTFACPHGEASTPSAFLADAGLVKSRGEAKRLIKEGALSIDGKRCDDALTPLAAGDYVVKLGKKRFLRLTVQG